MVLPWPALRASLYLFYKYGQVVFNMNYNTLQKAYSCWLESDSQMDSNFDGSQAESSKDSPFTFHSLQSSHNR